MLVSTIGLVIISSFRKLVKNSKHSFVTIMKKAVNIFLLLLLTVQILPVKQIGAALFNNIFTEEIAHTISIDDIEGKKCFDKSDYLCSDFLSFRPFVIIVVNNDFFFEDAIPHNHSTEILVPPPNC